MPIPFLQLRRGPSAPSRGCVGLFTSSYVTGWAARAQAPSPGEAGPTFSIRVNGETVGQVQPWLPRPDVPPVVGLAYARGFFFSFPRRLAHGDRIEVLDESGEQVQASPKIYEVASLPTAPGFTEARAAIASMFLSGAGLEIGAFTQPTDLPPEATVEYYDRFSPEVLRKFYDESCGRPLVAPTYFGNAQSLEGLPKGKSFDFIIANHVIEHLEDPIAFLKGLAGALKPAGRLMLIAPNKRFSFDKGRQLTPYDHLLDDHHGGAGRNRMPHFLEWVSSIDGLTGSAADQHARKLESADFSIHFHVWDENAFAGFVVRAAQEFNLGLALLFAYNAHHEMTLILEKI